jgi:HNH endonuclease.
MSRVSQQENSSGGRRFRSRTCPTCVRAFEYPIGKGRDRKHCSAICRITAQKASSLALRQSYKQSCVRNCGRTAYRKNGVCEACYFYERRTGKTGPAPRKRIGRYVTKAGYVRVLIPGHPMSTGDGMVYEHRAVIYHEQQGVLPSCFWCGCQVQSWRHVVIDHLNENKQDNQVSNLAPTCNRCNRARGAALPFLRRLLPGRGQLLLELAHVAV